MIFKPRPYQLLYMQHIFAYPRGAIWGFMGSGKTSATLMSLAALRLVEDSKALIIAPHLVALSTWPDEVKKWENLHDFKLVPVIGDQKERMEALREPADAHTINYENLPWLARTLGDNWPWETIVADESTRLKKFRLKGRQPKEGTTTVRINKKKNASRARTLGKYTWTKVKRFIELTGTPSPNGLMDLWGQLWYLDKGARLGRTFTDFKSRWFYYENRYSTKLSMFPYTQQQIGDLVKDICLSLKVEDWFDVDKPIIIDVPVRLPEAAYNTYRQMERMMFTEVLNNPIEAFNEGSKTQKCLQMAGGAIYVDDKQDRWEKLHDAKLDALERIVSEANGVPVLVSVAFKHMYPRLTERFPQCVILDKKKSTIDAWNRGEIPIMATHPARAGHGLNLQDGGNIVVMLEHTYDLEHYQQIIERIGPVRQFQAGHPRPVYIYNVRAERTIDNVVIDSRTSKNSIQELLREAARRS